MTTARLHGGLCEITPDAWSRVARPGALDHSHRYLSFLEQVHPGPAVAATVSDDAGICAAVHGAASTPETALFSNPWKMLAGLQFLRIDGADESAAEPVRRAHAELVRRLAGPEASADGSVPDLAQALGACLVIRSFDTSEILYRADVVGSDREKIAATLVTALQDAVRDGSAGAGAVAFPFVDPGDTVLRSVLRAAGFRSGKLTAVTEFVLTKYRSYDELLAAQPGRRRWHFRDERRQLDRDGLRLETADLAEHAERITELEIGNARKYGGAPDYGRLLAMRRDMARRLSGDVRVPVVRGADAGAPIVACGLQLVSDESYFCVVYGCDYTLPQRSTAYQCVNFYEPLAYATEHAIPRVRLGFEAFVPKLSRGATLVARETWLWLPDPQRLDAAGDLLELLSQRSLAYLDDLASQHTPL